LTNRGYVTAAYGHKVYLEQALCLLLSYRFQKDETPFTLVTDEVLAKLCSELNYNKWFDKIIILGNNQLHHFEGKLHAALQTPYSDTIYFDSDCLLIKEPETLWKELSLSSFCVPGGIYTGGSYANINMTEWLKHNQIAYLPVFNAGVFRFNNEGKKIVSEALSIIHEHETYRLPSADGGLNEQVALGIAMAKNSIMPLSYYNDLHFSFFNARSILKLDLYNKICKFKKERTWREPFIFHYTPLYKAGYYYSRSRKILERELNKLRSHFGIQKIEFFKPVLRDKLALIKRGRFLIDGR